MRRLLRPRRELPFNRPGLYRGKLAEDYDGIGQHVLVSLSSSSVGAAYRARVAAGDFGGNRQFPAGTPVTLHSYRGLVEVFLGNRPCGSTDKFGRIILGTDVSPDYGTGYWGQSDSGYTWETLNSSFADRISVDGEFGILYSKWDETNMVANFRYPPEESSEQNVLYRMKTGSFENFPGFNFTSVDLGFGEGPFGGDVYILFIFWDGTLFRRDGGGNLVDAGTTGVDVTEPFWVRVQASADIFGYKFWQDGDTEPDDFTLGTPEFGDWSQGGQLSIEASRNVGNQADAIAYIDEVDIQGVNRCTFDSTFEG